MLEAIFGNKTTELIMVKLYREGRVSAGVLAAEFGKSVRPFQVQLERLEDANLLVSQKIGNLRLYTFNPQSPFVEPLKLVIKQQFDRLSDSDRNILFSKRARPRKRGKEILNG